MQTVNLTIEGMSCGHCVARVRRTLEALDGVRVTTVQVGTAQAEIDPGKTSPETLAQAITDIGFAASAATVRAA